MTETDRLSELEGLLRRLPAAARATLLKGITELFLEGRARFSPRQVTMFERLFKQLVVDIDSEAAANFSRRLAPIASAPIGTIGLLAASDDIAVAEPVLGRSSCLTEAMLMDIARNKSQTHLLAIAIRPQLAAALVDVLVARGDDVVVRYVANNFGAQISAASAVALAERATRDEALAELIGKRTDIAAQLRTAALTRAKSAA